jgi:hypothetical protein
MTSTTLKRFFFATLVVAVGAIFAADAMAITIAKIADEWGTLKPGGVVGGTSGSRFLTVEGSNNGSQASTAPVRFYMTDVTAQLDTAYGVGGWKVQNVTLVIDSDTASFSLAGAVDVYHFTNDTIAITSGQDPGDGAPGEFSGAIGGPSSLLYEDGVNVLNTRTLFVTDASTLFGTVTQVDDIDFIYTGDVAFGFPQVMAPGVAGPVDPSTAIVPNALPNYGIDIYTDNSPDETYAGFVASQTLETGSNLQLAAIIADIESGNDPLSFMLKPGDGDVAATYKGNVFGGAYSPRIYITAVAIPEPSTLVLFGLGVMGLVGAVRRRQA